MAARTTPKRFVTGQVKSRLAPGKILGVSLSPWEWGVLRRSRFSWLPIRLSEYRSWRPLRSKALLLTRLIEPARESAGLAGVGTLETSIRAMSLRAIERTSTERVAVVQMFEAGAPSLVIAVIPPPMPRMDTPETSARSLSTVTPGRNFMNSPTEPPRTSPSASVERTFLMLGAKRCSLVAIAWASVSRCWATTNASRRTVASPCWP